MATPHAVPTGDRRRAQRETSSAVRPRDGRAGVWFWAALAAITAGGLVLRVLYVLLVTRHEDTRLYDSAYYELQAYALAHGHFFPILFGHGPDAAHPPLTSIVLVPVTYFFGLHTGETPQRLTMAVLGAVVVGSIGLLARRVTGAVGGLVAAGFAAVYPNMWIPNGILMSETLTMLVTVWTLLAVYRLLRSPTWANGALVGVGCGAAMLVRAELLLYVPLLLIPAAAACKALPAGRRLALGITATLVACLVVGPWVGRNLASFRDTTFLSNGEGPVVLGANCRQTYSGSGLGSWNLGCSLDVRQVSEQSVESTLQFDAGKRYSDRHLGRLPVVALARAGRVWDLYEPVQMVHVDVNEGRPAPAALAGLIVYYALIPLALVGAFALRRRRVTQWPLWMPAVAVTLIAIGGYGQVRFRAEFEVSLVVLAAAGVCAVWNWLLPALKRLRRSPGR